MDGRKWHGVVGAQLGEFRVGVFAFKFKTIGISWVGGIEKAGGGEWRIASSE
jgi:hypothetical protein